MRISKDKFGILPTGEQVYKYTLENRSGFKVGIINYGAAITEIVAPDRNGHLENIVLGYDSMEGYLENPAYLGCVVGRVSGRISCGEFSLNGKTYHLDKNNGENNLHGGLEGLSKKLWEVDKTRDGLLLSYTSNHMESGFPGEVEFRIRYLLTEENTLIIEYLGIPSMETIINLTNHTYFNLSGNLKSGGEKQFLKLESDFFCEVDEESLPTGEKISVDGGNFDFRNTKLIEDGLNEMPNDVELKIVKGYDHPFILKSNTPQIILFSEESGRKLEIETDQNVVVLYSGNYLEGTPKLGGGRIPLDNLGICLETQDYPDAVNVIEFPLRTYSPENLYRTKSIWKFSIK